MTQGMQTDSVGRTVVGPRDGGPADGRGNNVFNQRQNRDTPQMQSRQAKKMPVTFTNVKYPEGTALSVLDAVFPMPKPGSDFTVEFIYAKLLYHKHALEGKIVRKGRRAVQPKFVVPDGYELVRKETPTDEAADVPAIVPGRTLRQHEERVAAKEAVLTQEDTVAEAFPPDGLLVPDADDSFEFMGGPPPDEFIAAVNDADQDAETEDILDLLDD